MRTVPLIRTDDGFIRCTAVIRDTPCAGRMECRGTRMPSDPGRLYCTRCGADRAISEPRARRRGRMTPAHGFEVLVAVIVIATVWRLLDGTGR